MLHIRPDDDVDVYAADDDVDVDDSDQRGPREDDNPHGFLEYKNNGLRGFLWAPVICIVLSMSIAMIMMMMMLTMLVMMIHMVLTLLMLICRLSLVESEPVFLETHRPLPPTLCIPHAGTIHTLHHTLLYKIHQKHMFSSHRYSVLRPLRSSQHELKSF